MSDHLQIELDVDPAWGDEIDWDALAQAAARAAAQVAPELACAAMQVSLVLASDDEVHTLNREWRAKDRPTNVLSFPMLSREEVIAAAANPDAFALLGDVILARGVCEREAAEKGVSLADHATHLIIHGLLHLAGYDHEDGDEAQAMEALETKALALIGIADPYCGAA